MKHPVKLNLFKCLLFFILLMVNGVGYSQLTIKVTSVPATTLPTAKIYIAGTMNNWNPGSPTYELTKNGDGTFSITFTPASGTVKFKFTRGSWDTVEGTAQGTFIADRTTSYSGSPKTLDLTIAGWEGVSSAASTASPQVKVLTDTFFMPQLNKKRRIWLYLPKDYQASTSAYPVLYMHDGQNLFDKKTSFSGEWGVDEALDSMYLKGDQSCIVVGIDNGGGSRLNEYSPWVNTQYGGGQGDEYIDFISKTLKPYIDQNYRTLSDPEHTGIMGSSLGGLISMYAGIAYPDVFGKVGVFSSAFWFSAESYKQVETLGVNPNSDFYMIAGAKEGGNQVGDMNKMFQALSNSGASSEQLLKESHEDGQHSEWYWRREFPKAYKWLFEKKTSNLTDNIASDINISVAHDILKFSGSALRFGDNVSIYDLAGNLILKTNLNQEMCVDISSLEIVKSIYIINVGTKSMKVLLQ